MAFYISPPPGNPITRILAAIGAALALIGAFMLGLVTVAFFLAVGLLIWLGIWLRMAFLRRKLGIRPGPSRRAPPGTAGDHSDIETEYTVISKKQDL